MKTHKTMPLVIYSERALAVIQSETAGRFASSGEETGGILVGRRLDGQRILVVAASGPGPQATHRAHMFSPDVAFANRKLDELRDTYPGTDYLGVWHKHPATLDHPSRGDEAQIVEMFADPDYGHLEELLAPITLIRQGEFSLKTYYIDRSLVATQAFFQPVQDRVITADEAIALLTAPATDKWYATPDIEQRLAVELAYLNREFGTHIQEIEPDMLLMAQSHQRPQATVYFILHPGFPQTPPTTLLEYEEREWLGVESRLLAAWPQADLTLAHIASELISHLPPSAPPPRPQPQSSTPQSIYAFDVVKLILLLGLLVLSSLLFLRKQILNSWS
ncbi:MAG: Mov34/MPN/PAD-1 family protein [Anaerolineae bacterium]|nr:Mov34/MPN/PAD-1 family protein [Anaerolineae bacterium]